MNINGPGGVRLRRGLSRVCRAERRHVVFQGSDKCLPKGETRMLTVRRTATVNIRVRNYALVADEPTPGRLPLRRNSRKVSNLAHQEQIILPLPCLASDTSTDTSTARIERPDAALDDRFRGLLLAGFFRVSVEIRTQWCVAATHCVKAAAAHFAAVPSGHQKTLTLFPASSRGAPHNYYKDERERRETGERVVSEQFSGFSLGSPWRTEQYYEVDCPSVKITCRLQCGNNLYLRRYPFFRERAEKLAWSTNGKNFDRRSTNQQYWISCRDGNDNNRDRSEIEPGQMWVRMKTRDVVGIFHGVVNYFLIGRVRKGNVGAGNRALLFYTGCGCRYTVRRANWIVFVDRLACLPCPDEKNHAIVSEGDFVRFVPSDSDKSCFFGVRIAQSGCFRRQIKTTCVRAFCRSGILAGINLYPVNVPTFSGDHSASAATKIKKCR
ncbi:hypothetical protein GEV33_005094 [Tenebrio molitor]|uniref:Uncharacterized protein n=1 Tax=Tenebrio molitor TaxID=7067 RepID=A0A8J6HNH7_TENMO|nr:hypothetical protein GEV33_005094 [Tenebrio molitor]